MFKRIYIYLIILYFPFHSLGQESNLKIGTQYEPVYSQYRENGLAINPAYSGSRECFSANILYRNQWVGFEGAPVTQTLSLHTPFKDEKNAVGLFLFHEKIGVSDYIDVYGNYAFRFKLGNGKLSLGLKVGVTLFQGNFSKIQADPLNYTNDLLLTNESGTYPNFGVGAYYFTKNYFLGISVPQFMGYEIKNSQKKMSVAPENYNFLLTGGYLFELHSNIKFKPSFLFRYRIDDAYMFDVGADFVLYNVLWMGGVYRTNDEMALMLGYQVNHQIKAGVAYDIATGDLAGKHQGSMELMLRYEFKYKVRAVSPKFF